MAICSLKLYEHTFIIDRVAGDVIRLVASVCVRVCPFVCGHSPV